MSNGLVTVATVPEIGARLMQYDLGDHASIFVNSDETGRDERGTRVATGVYFSRRQTQTGQQARSMLLLR